MRTDEAVAVDDQTLVAWSGARGPGALQRLVEHAVKADARART
jgi:hypothetical protein